MKQITAQVSKSIAASPSRIWAALTDQAALEQFFMGAHVESDWRVGSPVRMNGDFHGKHYEDKGEVLEVEVGRRLSFSHWSSLGGTADLPENYHVVSFELTPGDEGTQVTLSQSNLQGGVKPSDVQHRVEYEKNWRSVLDGLDQLVTRRGGRP